MSPRYDAESICVCPYNGSHFVRTSRFQYHLVKCIKNYPEADLEMKMCPFNARHRVNKADFDHHMSTCLDRSLIEQDVLRAQEYHSSRTSHDLSDPVPHYVTNEWGNDEENDDVLGSDYLRSHTNGQTHDGSNHSRAMGNHNITAAPFSSPRPSRLVVRNYPPLASVGRGAGVLGYLNNGPSIGRGASRPTSGRGRSRPISDIFMIHQRQQQDGVLNGRIIELYTSQ